MNRISFYALLALTSFSLNAMDQPPVSQSPTSTLTKKRRYELFCALQGIFDAVEDTSEKLKDSAHRINSARTEEPTFCGKGTKDGFFIDSDPEETEGFFHFVWHLWGHSRLKDRESLSSGKPVLDAKMIFQEKVKLEKIGVNRNALNYPGTIYKVKAINNRAMPEPIETHIPWAHFKEQRKEWQEFKILYEQEHGKK